MSAYRCQICGRKKPLRKSGMIAHHCVGGPQCPGTGHPPIERDDAWLIAYAGKVEAAYRRAYDAVRALEEARANWIDPALIIRRGLLAGQSLKLRRRLKRHLSWPDRYRRSMERFGWATPPPDYLTERVQGVISISAAFVGPPERGLEPITGRATITPREVELEA